MKSSNPKVISYPNDIFTLLVISQFKKSTFNSGNSQIERDVLSDTSKYMKKLDKSRLDPFADNYLD
jgi:hypothetical protein